MSSRIVRKNPIESSSVSLSSKLMMIPLFLITIVLPLITKQHTYNTHLSKYEWFSTSDEFYDFYLYYKQWFFVFICAVILCILIIQHFVYKKELKFNRSFLPLLLYAVLALLSTIFSKYSRFGFTGNFEQFENVFCLVGYALIVYYIYQIIQSEAEFELLLNFVAVGALIIGIIGTLQTFGVDIIQLVFFNDTVTVNGEETYAAKNSIVKVAMTLYNPNYAGVYSSMMLTIFLTQLIGTRKKYQRILYALVVVTMTISLIGCESKTGLIGLGVSLLIVIIKYCKKIIKVWYVSIPVIVMMILGANLFNTFNNYAYVNSIKKAVIIKKDVQADLSELYTLGDSITLTYRNNTLNINVNEEGIVCFKDNTGNDIPAGLYQMANDNVPILQPQDERYYEILVADYTSINQGICIYAEHKYWSFIKDQTSGQYLYINGYNRLSTIEKPEVCFLEDYASFATYRGYIWSRTLPMLKNNIILGSGADTFIFEFPQNDYIGLYNHTFENVLISKPHNWYLQMGVQTGVISLLCIVLFFGIYIIQSIKIYFKQALKEPIYVMGFSLLIGVICYLINGIANDSCITIAPVFWVIVGLGYGLNYRIRIHEEEMKIK